MGDVIGRSTSNKKSQKSNQKKRKSSSQKRGAPLDQTSTKSNHETRKHSSQNIGSMFDKMLETLNSTPITDFRCPSDEFEQQSGNMCVSLKFFSDEYVRVSVERRTVWATAASLWNIVEFDRSAEPKALEPDDYFDQMMDWFETHPLNEFKGLSCGSDEYFTETDPIGQLVVDSKTKMAKLVEGNHRLLIMILRGGGFFPVKVTETTIADGKGSISSIPFWKVISGTSSRATICGVNMYGQELDLHSASAASEVSRGYWLSAVDIFILGLKLQIGSEFMGPLSLDQVVEVVDRSECGIKFAIVNTAKQVTGGQHWVGVLWEKQHSTPKPTIVVRVLETLRSSRISKPVVSTLKTAGFDARVQILRWQVERPLWKCGFYQLFIAIHAARQIQSGTAFADVRAERMPDRFITLVCDLVNAVKFNRKCRVEPIDLQPISG